MANTNETQPLADLRKDAVDHLDAIKGELDEATKDLDANTVYAGVGNLNSIFHHYPGYIGSIFNR